MRQEIRGSDVWLSTDLERIMQALALTVAEATSDEYVRGYQSALAAMAMVVTGRTPPPYVPDTAHFRT